MYYIQTRGFCGNSLRWWLAGGCGYTSDILKAGQFTREEAVNICRSRPDEDFPRAADLVHARLEMHVTNNHWPEDGE